MDDVLEAQAGKDFRYQAYAAAVQGRIDDLELTVARHAFRAQGEGQQVREIGVIHLLAERTHFSAAHVRLELHLGRIGNFRHFRDDFLVHGRGDLSAVGPGDLVAVVFLGVVGGGDHNARHGAGLADGVTHFGRRTDIVEDIHVDSVGAHHVRGDAGKFLAVVPAVVRNHHGEPLPLHVTEDVVGQALRRHPHRVLVHPVGAHAHNATQATGAEFQVLIEGILEAGRIFRTEGEDLHLGVLVEIAVEPALCGFFVLFHSLVFNLSNIRIFIEISKDFF